MLFGVDVVRNGSDVLELVNGATRNGTGGKQHCGSSTAHENDLGGGIRTWMEADTSFFC